MLVRKIHKRFAVSKVVLAALALIMLFIGTAFADEHPTAGKWGSSYWYLEDGTLTLTNNEHARSTAEEHWNYNDPVHVVVEDSVMLDEGQFEAQRNTIDAVIGEGVNISNWCFSGCERLETITLPSTMDTIGRAAFWECLKLKEINVPEGITTIEENTFYNCEQLKTVYLPSTLNQIAATAFELTGSSVSPTDIYFNGTRAQWLAITDDDNLINRPEEFTLHFIDDGDTPTSGIPVDEEHFPDYRFRNYVEEHFDQDQDWWLTDEELAAVKRIDINSKGISFLGGLEYFTSLTYLDCHLNKLMYVDVSELKSLEYLDCRENVISALNVSGCTRLQYLDCQINWLRDLDVSNCTELVYFYCGRNYLTTLDVSKQAKLVRFFCESNQLSELSLDTNILLEDFSCGENQLTSLDVHKCTELKDFNCRDNQLTYLDVSANTKLVSLYCPNNMLTTLNVSTNTQLKYLSCGMNLLSALSVRNNILLEELYCSANKITNLNLAKNPLLRQLYCGGNQLPYLSLSVNTALNAVSCYGNRLTELDLSAQPALTSLECYSNQLENIYFSTDATLQSLYCGNNRLTGLTIPNIGEFFPSNFDATGNVYDIPSSVFDLTKLPEGFNTAKASNWAGGVVRGTILTATSNNVTYQYDCGAGVTVSFSLSTAATADTLSLPSATTIIGQSAFEGITANIVVIPADVTQIQSRAFAGNGSLYLVTVYSRTADIANDAFEDCPNLILQGYSGSTIQAFAAGGGIPFDVIGD